MAKASTAKTRKPFKKKTADAPAPDTSSETPGEILISQDPRLNLELLTATCIQGVNLRTSDGVGRTQASHLGPIGGSEEHNKHGIKRLWSDGFFVYVFSDKYEPFAVPCSNVLQVTPLQHIIGWDLAKDEPSVAMVPVDPNYPFRQRPPGTPEEEYARDIAAFDPANQSEVGVSEVTPEGDKGPLYVINDPGMLISEELEAWLLEQMAGRWNRDPGEYVIINLDPLTSMLRLQDGVGTFHPIKIPEKLL